MDSTPKRQGCSSATIANSKTKCPQRCGHFCGSIWLWAGGRRSGAVVKGRLAFAKKKSASMGFRRAGWLERGAKRTLVRASDVRKPRCRIKPSAASAVYGGRKTADKKARPRLARRPLGRESWGNQVPLARRPGLGLRRAGWRPLGRRNWGSKLPLAIYLWKKRRFSYFGSQHTLMPSVR